MIDYTPDIRRMSCSTKGAVSVKVHFTQTIFFFCPTLQKPPGVSPSLPYCMPNTPKAQFHQQYFHPSDWQCDTWLHFGCWWAPASHFDGLWDSWLSVQWEHLHTVPTWQLETNHGIYIYIYLFQMVTSGLLADLAPICFIGSIANDCATIPGSCSRSDT